MAWSGWWWASAGGVVALASLCPLAAGCRSAPPPPRTVEAPREEVPEALRGTLRTMAEFNGIEPTLVSGFGLVVNLNGTGGGVLPEPIAATMERELARMGVGPNSELYQGTRLEGMTARGVLADPNVAVVVVRAAIPPGSPVDTRFDVELRALNATSLEGGRLFTTQLHLGPPTVFGGYQTRVLAEARGEVFTNPFVDPAEAGQRQRAVGRVLGGGVVTQPLDIELVLNDASHARARLVVEAINSRFPEGPGDTGPTARGRGSRGGAGQIQSIALRVPFAYRHRPGDFVELVRHLHLDYLFPQEHARRYVEALKSQPWLGTELSWCLEALGEPALPFLRELYDDAELVPRMAALRAGASLGDAMAARPLMDLARQGPPALRLRAIHLLGQLDSEPVVDQLLRELAGSAELDVRVAAYEALAQRRQRAQLAALVARERSRGGPSAVALHYPALSDAAETIFTDPGLQGVVRVPVGGDPTTGRERFLLDLVPFGEPMVYVTLSGRPRLALFGQQLDLGRPLLVSVWSDRLMLASEAGADPIRVYYHDYRTGRRSVHEVSGGLTNLIAMMARDPRSDRPEPGLGLGYAEVVGALYAMHESGGLDAPFATEQDRLYAALLKATRSSQVMERPERDDDEPRFLDLDPVDLAAELPRAQERDGQRSTLVVPLRPKSATQP